jgi:VanZ family protein
VRRAAAWLPALAWAGAIFFLSSRSTLPAPGYFPSADKLAHFVAYAIGGALLARAVLASAAPLSLAVALGWLHGIGDEWHQSFVPGRSVDVWDWVADALGIVAGVYLYNRWHARRRGTEAPSPAGGRVDFLET